MLILRCLCGQWNPDKTGCHKQENDQFVRTSLEFRTLCPKPDTKGNKSSDSDNGDQCLTGSKVIRILHG